MYTLKAKTHRGDLYKRNNHNLLTCRSDLYKPNNHNLFPLAILPSSICMLLVNLIYRVLRVNLIYREKKASFPLILKNTYIISLFLRLKPCVKRMKCLMQIKP